jgi:YD repeat-containing protein
VIRLKLPDGTVVALERNDADRLVSALWDASATQGAVVAIGRIVHRLEGDDALLELSELEQRAIEIALANDPDLPPALAGVVRRSG